MFVLRLHYENMGGTSVTLCWVTLVTLLPEKNSST